jgi:hypothetical protein
MELPAVQALSAIIAGAAAASIQEQVKPIAVRNSHDNCNAFCHFVTPGPTPLYRSYVHHGHHAQCARLLCSSTPALQQHVQRQSSEQRVKPNALKNSNARRGMHVLTTALGQDRVLSNAQLAVKITSVGNSPATRQHMCCVYTHQQGRKAGSCLCIQDCAVPVNAASAGCFVSCSSCITNLSQKQGLPLHPNKPHRSSVSLPSASS